MTDCPIRFDDYAEGMKVGNDGPDFSVDSNTSWAALGFRQKLDREIRDLEVRSAITEQFGLERFGPRPPEEFQFDPRTRRYGWEDGRLGVRGGYGLLREGICYRCGKPFSHPYCVPIQDSGDAPAKRLSFDPDTVVDAESWPTVELEQ